MTTTLCNAKWLETFSEKIPADDSIKTLDVNIDLGIADFELMAAVDSNLVTFDVEYNPKYLEPEFDFEKDGEHAYVYMGIDSDYNNHKKKDMDDTRFEVTLSKDVEIEMSCDLGLSDNTLDLSALKIKRLEMDSGLSSTEILLTEANPIRSDLVEIECGLGEFDSDHIGYLLFDELVVEGGLGDISLDLRGYEGDGVVEVSVGMGSCTLIIPRDVGVKLRYDKGLFSSVDAPRFERVRGNLYKSRNYSDKESTLDIDVSVGMGSVDIRWRD